MKKFDVLYKKFSYITGRYEQLYFNSYYSYQAAEKAIAAYCLKEAVIVSKQ